MWAEYVGAETVDSRIWSRMLAVAERLWSPGSVTDVADMYRRLDVIATQLGDIGVDVAGHSHTFVVRMMNGAPGGRALEQLLAVTEPGNFGQRADAIGLRYLRGPTIDGIDYSIVRKVSIAIFHAGGGQ